MTDLSKIQEQLDCVRCNDDGVPTHTSKEQQACEERCAQHLAVQRARADRSVALGIGRDKLCSYLFAGTERLSTGYQTLDASRPWLCYWIINALDLLDQLNPQSAQLYTPPCHTSSISSSSSSSSSDSGVNENCQFEPVKDDDSPNSDQDSNVNIDDDEFEYQRQLIARMSSFLTEKCQDHVGGGFCGGPGQIAHCAPSYAATNALVALGDEDAWRRIDRQRMYQFLMARKDDSGAFSMHDGGETDVRSTYCAVAVASMLNLLTPQLVDGVAGYIRRCQTFEGGIGGEPGNEAHGGYAFCGLAAATLLGCASEALDLRALLHWAVHRQMPLEGGFQGRTNKLVDSCYSFWQGALFPLLADALPAADRHAMPSNEEARGRWLFDQLALQDYLLMCCRQWDGGFCDKPPKRRDYYHTCYSLNGLSIAQNNGVDEAPTVAHCADNLLVDVHPAFGVSRRKVERAMQYFRSLPLLE
jgi:protein farnesyltransferase subunit beta